MGRGRVSLVCAAAIALLATASAGAQVGSSLQSISLQAVKGQHVTLGAPNPGVQSLTIVDDQVNAYGSPFSIAVSWSVDNSTATTVKLVGYFATPSQALVNGTAFIASSRVEASVDGGATWAPFTGNAVGGVGAVGGSQVLFTSPVTQGSNRDGTQTVTFLIRLNLVGASTPSGVYSGTLYLMAICN